MAGMVFIITIPSGENERKTQIKINSEILNELNLNNKLSDTSKIIYKNQLNNQTRELLEIAEKSNLGSKESIVSRRSKSSESVTAPLVDITTINKENNHSNKSETTTPTRTPISETGGGIGFTHKKTKSYESLIENNTPSEDSNSNRKSWDGIKNIISGTNSTKKDKTPPEKKLSRDEDENLLKEENELNENSTMEEVLRNTLKNMRVSNDSWILINKNKSYQITFSMESTLQCEDFLRILNDWGIGEREGTSISLIPCTLYHKPYVSTQNIDQNCDDDKESAWDKFLFSIRARLNVAQIVEEVKKDASVTFDFLCLVVVAAILAAVGLVEDSTIFLASSMLISPLMGPIIAAIFGTVIIDRKLQYLGVVNELIGISVATSVGFIFGLIVCGIDEKYGNGEGVTKEMLSRCELHSLVVGIFTAIPSGAAVAIAILGENIGSLVGVAISASLLPPAVNAGVLWSLSFVYAVFQQDKTKYNNIVNSNIYSDHQSLELAALGSMSMGLTIINIICIYFMGVLFLKIKEVAPINSRNQREFWKHDIKIARDYYKTCQSEDALTLGKKLADEFADFKQHDTMAHQQNTWSPLSSRNQHTVREHSKPSIPDLETLFHHTIQPQASRPITFRRQSVMGKSMSPPVTNRDIYNYLSHQDNLRRPSHPFDHLTIHHFGTFHPTHHLNPHHHIPLDKIVENIPNENGGGTSSNKRTPESTEVNIDDETRESLLPDGNKSRKFIVTPAADPLHKSE